MRLEVLLREERVVDLGALDPAEAEQRQRLRRDAEDVLEQDDAGRLVRHARVDLRGGARSSPPSLYAASGARARRGGVGRLQVRILTHPDVGPPRPARIAPVAISAARRVQWRRRVAGRPRPLRLCSTGVKRSLFCSLSDKE